MSDNTGAGKGDKPRNCFSKEFRNNYDEIDWGRSKKKTPQFEHFDLCKDENSQLENMEEKE